MKGFAHKKQTKGVKEKPKVSKSKRLEGRETR
jgi:hypothetical protein